MNYVHRIVRLFALTVIFIVLLSSSSLSSSELRVEQIGDRFNAGEGYMEMYGPLVFMHLKGTPYEMGLQHGTLLAYLYSEDYLLKMKDELDPFKAQASGFEQLVQTFKKFYFQYKMAPWILRNIPEDLFQELEGIVAGVSGGKNTDPMEVIIANVSQDLGMTFGCTSIVAFGEATANGSLYHARNLDNLSMVDWAQYGYVVVYEPDYGYPFITHIYPIYAGTMQAMNNQGITVSMNYSLVDQEDNSLDGMAMVFLMRQIVQHASTLDEALEIVLSTPRTFGMNIVISDSKIPDAVVLEVDASRYAIRRAKDGLLSATNQYNTEYMRQFQASGWLSSARREERLGQFFSDNYGDICIESMVELLRDRGEPGSAEYGGLLEGINNAGSMLSCVFSPEEQMMWISIPDEGRGSPDSEFYAFSLTKALAGEDPAIFSRNIKPTKEDYNLANWLLVREATLAYSQNELAATLEYLEQLDPEFTDAEAVVNLRAHTYLRLGNQAQTKHNFQMLAERPYVTEPFYLLQALIILGSIHDNSGDRFAAQNFGSRRAKQGAVIIIVIYIFILGSIVDRLQRQGLMPGHPLFSFIPGWTLWYNFFDEFSGGYMITNVLRGLPFFVLIPAFVLYKLGVRKGEFGFFRGDLKPALPFLIIYMAAFLFSGLTIERWIFLVYAIMYAGFQEEFFFRGVMQPLFIAITKKPIWGIGLSTLLFALLHIPDFVFRVYPTVPLALSSVASTSLFGGLMAYGVYRTGMLWPWILIHALSNVVGF